MDDSPWADTSPHNSPQPPGDDIWGIPSSSTPPPNDQLRRSFEAVNIQDDDDAFGESERSAFANVTSASATATPSKKGKERDLSPPRSAALGGDQLPTPTFSYTPSTPMKEEPGFGGDADGADDEFGDDSFGAGDGNDDDFAFAPTHGGGQDGGEENGMVDEDDFGDFGDFDDGAGGAGEDTGDIVGGSSMSRAEEGIGFSEEPEAWDDGLPERIPTLILSPFPSISALTSQIAEIILPIYPALSSLAPSSSTSSNVAIEGLTDEPVRQVEGIGQILNTTSRQLYTQMTTAPALKPLDWTRSRTRREHLISLGVPVNLDEVESHRLTALPPLRITTNGITPRSSLQSDRNRDSRNLSASSPLAEGSGRGQRAIPARSGTKDERALGARPAMDREKAKRLLAYKEAELSLFPPKYISKMQDDLVEACSSASNVLAHLKQLVEIRKDDNKRKNEQIAELIARAQRLKADEALANSGGLFRKGSTKRDSRTLSGSNTPKRVSSPAFR